MIKEVTDLINAVGFVGTLLVLFLVILILALKIVLKQIKFMIDQNKLVIEEIRDIRTPYLTTDQTIDIFKDKAFVHTELKVEFLRQVLENNNLKTRKEQIKKNIINECVTITNKGIESLSGFKSVIGDVKTIIASNIDWNEFFDDTFKIVFNEKSTNKQKIFDFRKIMAQYISKIEMKLRQAGDANE